MRKYKSAIKIGEHIQDIWQLKEVVAIRKCIKDIRNSFGGVWYTDKWIEVEMYDGKVAKTNDWLVKDICDNIHVMTDEEYNNHYNDELFSK